MDSRSDAEVIEASWTVAEDFGRIFDRHFGSVHRYVVRQNTAPGTLASCGTIVDVTVAYRPGIHYIVQEGDTCESIATSQGITLDQLLGFSSLTVAELELAGQDPSAPLALGQALRLSNSPATLNTVPTTTA